MDDKRDAERVPMLGQVQGGIIVFEAMLLRDISPTGATIDTRFPLQINSLHDLRLALGDTSVIVKGRVVHSRISDVDQDIVIYRSGMEFVELTERAASAIARFIEAVKTNRSGV